MLSLSFLSPVTNNPQSQETPKETPQETPEDKPQESEEKKESVGDNVTEEALQKVMDSNADAIAVGMKIKNLIYDPGSYTVEFELKAPEGGTFSFTTDEDYEKLKEYLEKQDRYDESQTADLGPGKYEYIKGKITITKTDDDTYSFTYKEKDKEEVTLTSAEECQLVYDVDVIDFISYESTKNEDGNNEYIEDIAINSTEGYSHLLHPLQR